MKHFRLLTNGVTTRLEEESIKCIKQAEDKRKEQKRQRWKVIPVSYPSWC